MKHTDNIAVVTGSSRGIGLAITRELTEQGIIVAGWSRTAPVDFSHPNYHHFYADLTGEQSVESAFNNTLKKLGHNIGFLINNAGAGYWGNIEEMEPEKWRYLFDLNVHGLFYTSRLIIPGMKERQNGHIINISSGAGTNGIAGMSAYCGTKYAVNGISDSMHKELRDYGIKVTRLSPGSVDTGFSSSKKNKLQTKDLARAVLHILQSPANFHYTDVHIRPLQP